MRHRSLRRAALGLVLALLLPGCFDPNPTGTVTGTVTLDDVPVKKGLIKFIPTDGKTSGVETNILDGKYSATVPVGEVVVQIKGDKVVGKFKAYDTPESPVVEKVEELIPQRYNVRSDLK